jgi:hypothetical protein
MGWRRSQILRLRESLVLYKSCNTPLSSAGGGVLTSEKQQFKIIVIPHCCEGLSSGFFLINVYITQGHDSNFYFLAFNHFSR